MDPDIKHFEETVLSAFARLSNYGFRHKGTQIMLPDLYVHFRNETTAVKLSFEVGTGPWVDLGRLALIPGGPEVEESYGIRHILAERAPDEEWRFRCEIDDPGLPAALERLAFLVEKYAKDVLEGDFSIFPQLKLRFFCDIAMHGLRFLEPRGFTHFKTVIHLPNVEVRFRSEKVEVAALYEIGSRPWSELSRLVSIDGRIEKVDSFDLELLLKERAPDEEYEGDFDIDGGMQYGILRSSRLLEQYGQDVLQGDFSKV